MINEGERELHEYMHNYIAFLALDKENEDIIMTHMENYFTHKLYNHDLGDLMPTVLSNALGLKINIIEELNSGNVRETYIKPEKRTNHNETGHVIFIHLKDSHYSALVPLKYLSKWHRMDGVPNLTKFCSNKFAVLHDAPDTCIYTESAFDSGLETQNIPLGRRMVEDKCATIRNNIHENSNRSM